MLEQLCSTRLATSLTANCSFEATLVKDITASWETRSWPVSLPTTFDAVASLPNEHALVAPFSKSGENRRILVCSRYCRRIRRWHGQRKTSSFRQCSAERPGTTSGGTATARRHCVGPPGRPRNPRQPYRGP